jgi:MYXO-CTERM domain-containing protein
MKRATLSRLRTSLMGGAAGIALVFGASAAVRADTLHGECTGCIDGSFNGSTGVNLTTSTPFSFFSSGGNETTAVETVLDILVPDTGTLSPTPKVTITNGSNNFTSASSLINTSPWTSGMLDAYIAAANVSPTGSTFSGSPASPLPPPGTEGFYVYQADLGSQMLAGTSSSFPPASGFAVMDIANVTLPTGTYVAAFQEIPQGMATWSATAQSGWLVNTDTVAVPGPTAGAGLPGLALAGIGLFIGWRRRRRVDA